MKRYFIVLGLLLLFLNSFSQTDYSGNSNVRLSISSGEPPQKGGSPQKFSSHILTKKLAGA